MTTHTIESITCKTCGFVAKSPWGLRKHQESKHTEEGAAKAKLSARKGADKRMGHNTLKESDLFVGIAPTKRTYTRRNTQIEHISCVKFCPKCGCNVQAVGIAMNFKP